MQAGVPEKRVRASLMKYAKARLVELKGMAFGEDPYTIPKWDRMKDVELVMRWLRATKDLKQQRTTSENAKAWAELFAYKRDDLSPENLMNHLVDVSSETLRRARVRLDATCMLIHRKIWRQCLGETVSFHIYIDGSPQKRGSEMLAISYDVCCWPDPDRCIQRYLFPVLKLGHGQLTLVGKALMLIWAVFLVFGPHEEVMRCFFDNVTAVCSDLGTERLLPTVEDLLPHLFGLVRGHNSTTKLSRQAKLMPRAIQMQGWKHLWDNVLQRICCSIEWFPE